MPRASASLLRAIAEGKPDAPDQILARWTWRLARAVRKTLDRKASQEYQDAKRLLGALANSRGHRHEENAAQARHAPRSRCRARSARRCSPRPRATRRASTQLIEAARERLGTIQEIAGALADDLPAPKTGPSRARRRRRKKAAPAGEAAATPNGDKPQGEKQARQAAERGEPATPSRSRRRRRRSRPRPGRAARRPPRPPPPGLRRTPRRPTPTEGREQASDKLSLAELRPPQETRR